MLLHAPQSHTTLICVQLLLLPWVDRVTCTTLLCAIYHCYTSTQRVSQQATQGNSAPHRFTTPSLCEKWRVPTTNALNIEHRANNNDRINTSTLIFRCGLLHAKIHRSPLLPHWSTRKIIIVMSILLYFPLIFLKTFKKRHTTNLTQLFHIGIIITSILQSRWPRRIMMNQIQDF